MKLNGEVKRLIIYFIYDKDGIVDDYIIYMLNALKKNTTDLMVVCNGKLTPESRTKLNPMVDYLIVRENKGLDVWAYKTGIDYLGWDKISAYDEMIMMNFTIMGPVYDLSEMFGTMNEKDIDFWGVSMYHEYKEGDPFGTIEVGYIPDHIQSHFIAVRKSMFSSIEFQEYWNNMGEIRDYRDAVGKHEAMFTKRFSDKGFVWDVYADLGAEYNNHPILMATKKLMVEKRCPFFKRRSFFQNYDNILTDGMGQNTVELFEFLDKSTDYDVDMIWQNILRLENQADIKKNMQLNYILSDKVGTDVSAVIKNKKIALVLHFYFDDLAEYCLHYVQSMPKEADIYVTVGDEKRKKIIEETFAVLENKVKVILIENRGRDVSALLVGTKEFIMDYDYVCFVHDKKVKQILPESIGADFSYKCFENLLTTKEFVTNVIDLFEKNKRLGLLTPAPPNHGDYYITMGMEWGPNFDVTKKLAKKLELTIPIVKEKEPIAPLGTMFWFRPSAMKRLFDEDWEYSDFPKEPNAIDGTLLHAIERIYSYVVQEEGYYPAWIFSTKLAAMEITNLGFMLRENNNIVFNSIGAGRFVDTQGMLASACSERRKLQEKVGTVNKLFEAKLYLDLGNGYSEENSVISYNIENQKELAFYYVYEDLQKFRDCISVRWDPCESNVMVYDLKMEVIELNGKRTSYNMSDFNMNGFKYDNALCFVGNDPQFSKAFDDAKIISKIIVEGSAYLGLTSDFENRVAQLFSEKGNIVRRIIKKRK